VKKIWSGRPSITTTEITSPDLGLLVCAPWVKFVETTVVDSTDLYYGLV